MENVTAFKIGMKQIAFVLLLCLLIPLKTIAQQPWCTTLVAHQTPDSRESPGTFTFWVTDETGQSVDAIYKWEVVVNGELQPAPGFNEGPNYTTTTVSETTSYQLTATVSFGCLQQIGFSATIAPFVYTTPPVPNHVTRCGPGAVIASVQARPNFVYEWYDGITGTKLTTGIDGTLSTGQTYTIGGVGNSEINIPFTISSLSFNVTGSDIYYPQGGAPGTPVNVTINPVPVVGISNLATSYCSNTNVPLVGSPANGTWTVDDQPITNGFLPNQLPQGPHLVKYTYVNEGGCSGSAQEHVYIRSPPSAPATKDVVILYNTSASLSAENPNPDYAYQWFTSGNAFLTTTQNYVTPFLTATTSYLIGVIDVTTGCESDTKSMITVIVKDPRIQNYIRENIIAVKGITNRSEIPTLEIGRRNEKTDYFDGLGRPMQTVVTGGGGSSLKRDLVQPVVYDAIGRENIKYLPYISNESSGDYKISPLPEATGFYDTGGKIAEDGVPFSKAIFEPSPLNRIIKQGAPGQTWQPNENVLSMNDKSIKQSYEGNGSQEVMLFQFNETLSMYELSPQRYYAPTELYANKTFDELNKVVIEYVDKSGKTVCKKVQSNKPEEALAFASTYYIYDDFGNLILVLPPEGVEKVKTLFNLN